MGACVPGVSVFLWLKERERGPGTWPEAVSWSLLLGLRLDLLLLTSSLGLATSLA